MMTVGENIALALSANNAKEVIKSVVQKLLSDVNLQGKESAFPSQLSGGQTDGGHCSSISDEAKFNFSR